jgi:hypothetical protein
LKANKLILVGIISLIFLSKLLCQKVEGNIFSLKGDTLVYVYVIGNKGNELTLTDDKGYFNLILKHSDSVTFSMIGFNDTTIAKDKLSSNFLEIRLKESNYLLKELTVKPISKKNKKYSEWTKEEKGKSISSFGITYGGKIAYKISNPKSKLGIIQEIIINIEKCKDNTFVRLRVNEIKDNLPEKDLLIENKIIFIKKGDSKIKILTEKDMIFCPKEGCFIGLDYVDNAQKKDIKKILEPRIVGITTINENPESLFTFNGKKWKSFPFYNPHRRFDIKVKITYYED